MLKFSSQAQMTSLSDFPPQADTDVATPPTMPKHRTVANTLLILPFMKNPPYKNFSHCKQFLSVRLLQIKYNAKKILSVRKNFVSFENFYTGFIQFSQNIGESFTQSVFFQISEPCARRNKRLPSRPLRPTIFLLRLPEKSLFPALTFYADFRKTRFFLPHFLFIPSRNACRRLSSRGQNFSFSRRGRRESLSFPSSEMCGRKKFLKTTVN